MQGHESPSNKSQYHGTMKASRFLALYEEQGYKPAYVRGAKAYIKFCFDKGLPITEQARELFCAGKSASMGTFSKKAQAFFDSLDLLILENDLEGNVPAQFNEAIKAFLTGYAGIASEETRKTYGYALDKYFVHCHIKALPLFHTASVISYRDYLVKEGKTASYINLLLSALRSMADFVLENRHRIAGIGDEEAEMLKDLLRVKNLKSKTDTYRKPSLSERERTHLMNTIADKEDRLMASLMAFEGFRRGEVARAMVKDFDITRGRVMVRGKGYQSDPIEVKLLPYSAKLAKEVIGSKKSGRLFSVTKEMVSRKIKNYMEVAGLMRPGLSAHSLRHTALQVLTDKGASQEVVQMQGRHASPATTQIYTKKALRERFMNDMEDFI